MPALNLRKVDVTLVTRLKADAAMAGVTLKDHCVGLLEATRGRSDDDGCGTGAGQTGSTERAGDRTTVPILPKAKSDKKRLHPVYEVRPELERGSSDRSPSVSHATHKTFPDGERGTWCSTCKLHY